MHAKQWPIIYEFDCLLFDGVYINVMGAKRLFQRNTIPKKLEEAEERKDEIIIQGQCKLLRSKDLDSPAPYVRIHQAFLPGEGRLSLDDQCGGELSISNQGELTLT